MMQIFENGLDMLVIVWSLGCAVVGCTFGIAKAAENQRQRFLHRNLTRSPREDEKNPNSKVAVPKIFTSANKSGHILEIQQGGVDCWRGEQVSPGEVPSSCVLLAWTLRVKMAAALIFHSSTTFQKWCLMRQNNEAKPCTITLHVTFYESQQKRVCDTISSVLFMRLR